MKGTRPNKKEITGTVISASMDKSITVGWETRKRHPIYGKFIKQRMKVKAHDAENRSKAGDMVRIIETRPISKNKAWRLVEILEKKQRG